ncbi:MAG: hypothetical protein ACK40G_07235 [Cytophagaceae bacterium]
MKLIDTIIFAFSAGFLLIGIHQAMLVGFAQSYWLIMISALFLLILQIRKKKVDKQAEQEPPKQGKNKSKKKKVS